MVQPRHNIILPTTLYFNLESRAETLRTYADILDRLIKENIRRSDFHTPQFSLRIQYEVMTRGWAPSLNIWLAHANHFLRPPPGATITHMVRGLDSIRHLEIGRDGNQLFMLNGRDNFSPQAPDRTMATTILRFRGLETLTLAFGDLNAATTGDAEVDLLLYTNGLAEATLCREQAEAWLQANRNFFLNGVPSVTIRPTAQEADAFRQARGI